VFKVLVFSEGSGEGVEQLLEFLDLFWERDRRDNTHTLLRDHDTTSIVIRQQREY
jgi:hypothetical protein